ncbi:hypothetical protein MPDQ_006639 [Monascus purpureus]|uniref:Haloacid dehalogenase, type II n=1 Tax=Monascus purpureus TaxID=5098 RepID=A0A507R2G0_MONPU|nr:hypothetical protein MPDQ_006639 [Monascus purpureus]BDD60639.1 hypothetical protein MAP00_005745 [Monascus purpureus]
MTTDQTIVAFDLYGTLLSTDSIVRQLEQHFGQAKAQSISASWRRYQLEYTWRLNSMGRYESFSDITRNSLHHSLMENGSHLHEEYVDRLLQAYDNLSAFPDVNPTLSRLATTPGIAAVVFSNGTQSMVSNSVLHSQDLSSHASIFRDIITVDHVKQYKPAPAVYKYLAEKMGKTPSQMKDIWLVSSNPFDVVGARSVEMNAIWVDRAARGWMDATLPSLRPTVIVHQLEDTVGVIESLKANIFRGDR